MRTWHRARVAQACGGACRSVIPKGHPLLEIHLADSKRVRCAVCAKSMFGEDPPTELPDDQPSLPPDFERLRQRLVAVAEQTDESADFKRRQSGEDV